MRVRTRDLRVAVAVTCVAGVLYGCLDSGSDNNAGTIGFEEGASVSVRKGSTRPVVLSLRDSRGVTAQSVKVAVSDPAIAEVFPDRCTLSSSSEASSKCTVTIKGKSTGTIQVAAQSAGYSDAVLGASVSDSITYGNLAVASDAGTFVSTSPVGVSFRATGATPYQKTLKAQISGSSGIDASAGAYINFSTSASGVTFNPPQCQVTSSAPECDTVASFTTATAATISTQVVGAIVASHTYNAIAVNATPNTTPSYGTIAVGTQSGNNVPNGMKAPLFVNWINASEPDTVTVVLSIAGSGVSFYSFSGGTNTTYSTTSTQTCKLAYTGTGAAPSCGFGLAGSASSGSVTINATATATSGRLYPIAPLTLGAIAPAAPTRSLTFTNNSASETIYVGITGGAASAYTSPTQPVIPPGTPSADVKPGAGSTCGPSNPQAACPIGSACLQGGASPNTDFTKSPFYCYYDQPVPSNGYAIAPNGGATTISIPGSSVSPGGVIWSGNFYARTGCDATTGICENATCVGAAGGLACGPGTGASPGVNTLAETTFQAHSGPDYYDVSIINGLNFATQFGPTNIPVSTSDAYQCGVAGSTSAQNGGWPANATAGLPAASWLLNPTADASFPPGVTITDEATSYYRMVVPSDSTAASCTNSRACAGAGPSNTQCGYRMSDVVTGSFDFAPSQRYCGKPVAFLTADSIRGFNSTSSNAAPFSLSTQWANGQGGTVSVGDLQLCINSTFSAYVGNGTTTSVPPFPIQPVPLACGGVMWGATETPGPLQNPSGNAGLGITRPAQPVQTANINWLDYVLPTIKWIKQACPTCYTYPFDDMTSTFTCVGNSASPGTNYAISFSDLLIASPELPQVERRFLTPSDARSRR